MPAPQPKPSRSDLETFVHLTFGGLEGDLLTGQVSLRIFKENMPTRIRNVPLASGLGPLADVAWQMIQSADGGVFSPPVAIFKHDAKKAAEADLLAGVAICVELDQNPAHGRQKLESVLGSPTIVVESGGRYSVEELGLDFPKLHLYWVLEAPAIGPDLETLKTARKLACKIGGGDPTAISLVHPLRWPGSLHAKDPNNIRLCRIAGGDHARRLDLAEAITALTHAASAEGVDAEASRERVDDRDTLEIVRALTSGEGYHPNLTPLAMRLAAAHVPQPLATSILRGIMLGVGSGGDPRWQDRYDALPATIGSAYAKVAFEASAPWAAALAVNGRLRGDWNTYYRALRTAPLLANSFRWNIRAKAIEIDGPVPWRDGIPSAPIPAVDSDITNLCVYLSAAGIPVESDSTITKCLHAVAQLRAADPVVEYLNALKWDGRPRVATWLTDICGATPSDDFSPYYISGAGQKWLISAVARALRPGCKADCMLILEGSQGIKKSSLFRVLGGQWFTDNLGDLSGDVREVALRLQGYWLVEAAELDALRKADVSRLKDFLSRTEDIYRAPYGRLAEKHLRTCVFAGTINPRGDSSYLQDDTGNRRFWPVPTPGLDALRGSFDTDRLADMRDQLWAEAVALYKSGAPWWFERNEEQDAVAAQEARTVQDTWADVVRDWLDKQAEEHRIAWQDVITGHARGVTTREVLHLALGIAPERQSHPSQIRAGAAIKAAGWVLASGRNRPRRYIPPRPRG